MRGRNLLHEENKMTLRNNFTKNLIETNGINIKLYQDSTWNLTLSHIITEIY